MYKQLDCSQENPTDRLSIQKASQFEEHARKVWVNYKSGNSEKNVDILSKILISESFKKISRKTDETLWNF